jgi:hypothetical protein
MMDGLPWMGKFLLGVSSSCSWISSSMSTISSQHGHVPPAPSRWQGRLQSWHHCSPR